MPPSSGLTSARSWVAQSISRADSIMPGYLTALAEAKDDGTQQEVSDARIDLGLIEGVRACLIRARYKLEELT